MNLAADRLKLAQLQLNRQQVPDAIASLREVLELNPQDDLLQFQLGKYFRNLGLIEEAITCFCRTLKLNPHHSQTYTSLSYIELTPQWRDRTETLYREILVEHPNIPEALANLAELLSEGDNLTEAIAFSRRAIYTKTIKENPQLTEIDLSIKKQQPPDFIIIGAGKAGTTSLYKYLSYHPQIVLPNKKELRFFDKNFHRGYEWYLAQFPAVSDRPNVLTGEASPSYFFLPHVAQRIKDFALQTKLIVMLRHPVTRTISDYYQNQKTGNQTKTLVQSIQQEIAALNKKNEQQLSYGGGAISQSLYYYKLKRWLKIFPKQQFLILNSELFFTSPDRSMERVYRFLDLPSINSDNYLPYNTGSYPEADSYIKQQLADFFSIHNQKLEEFLGINFNW